MIGRTLLHYTILDKLGGGGMGEVYVAEDTKLGRKVALKILRPELASFPDRRARFEREAKAVAALNHPNIVTIYSVEEADGEHFFTMELVEGKTLGECIPPSGLHIEKLLDVAVAVTDALSAAHGRDIIHRDLKPSNIMVTVEGRVKILDFGLAKLRPHAVEDGGSEAPTLDGTGEGTILGTLPYMSPEQFEGKAIDPRTDIFSLGVILYEMATGRRPFTGGPAALIASILHEEPAAATTLKPNLPPELDRLIRQCLEKEPSRRIQSAPRAREELEAIHHRMEAKSAGIPSGEVVPLAPRRPSIAVLPFANMSADKEQEYFCDGIAEETINALTQLEGLHVVARTSAFAFKGKLEDIRTIGRKLDVDTVLEGSVRKAGDRLRITTQLVNVADGYHIWSERFDRKAEDVFAIQDETALAVVEKLKVKLLSGEQGALLRRHTEDRDAHDHYLKGRYFFNRRYEGDFQRAIKHFQEAIAHDPIYVLPHVGIADVFNILGLWGFLPPGAAYSKAKAAAERALEIDETFADAHVAMAAELTFYEWDWKRADYHFKRAFELKLSKAIGYTWAALHLAAGEKHDAASEMAHRAVELDPLSPIVHTAAGATHVGIGRVDDALGLLQKALELDPNIPVAHFWLGWCYVVRGRCEGALESLRRAQDSGLLFASGVMAIAMGRSGMREPVLEIRRRLDELSTQRYVPFIVKAFVHVGLGDRDGYLDHVKRARAEREPYYAFLTGSRCHEGMIPSSWVAEMPQAWGM